MNYPNETRQGIASGARAKPTRRSRKRGTMKFATIAMLGAFSLVFSACSTVQKPPPSAAIRPTTQILREGDVVKIAFPGAPTLDTTQQIRRDGRINLYLVGEIVAANLTPADLEKQLLEKYSSQLVAKEVRVTLVSSAFSVFVTGAVVRPGKLTPERTLTAFEAIMEAGGFDFARANTKSVMIIRNEGGQTRNITLNFKPVLEGKQVEPFYLEAYDVVYVPEKFSWF